MKLDWLVPLIGLGAAGYFAWWFLYYCKRWKSDQICPAIFPPPRECQIPSDAPFYLPKPPFLPPPNECDFPCFNCAMGTPCGPNERWNWCVKRCINKDSKVADCPSPCGCDAGAIIYSDGTYQCVGLGRPSIMCTPPKTLDPISCQCV